MTTLLIKNSAILVTMDDAGREIRGGGLFARDGVIEAVGLSAELPATADQVLDLKHRHVVIPGLVNTHHHLYQSLTRCVPGGQDASLHGWLRACYPIWTRIGPQEIRTSTLTGLAELLLSGCTTASDHLYIFPNGARLDDQIEAAGEIGIRFHATRGSMSVGESQGGLPPDCLVEDEGAILADCQRVIEAFDDRRRHALLRIGLAPCSPFSISEGLLQDTARMARAYGVELHTHTAENAEDVAYCRERFRCEPVELMERLGWTGRDTWHAHCVHLDANGIGVFARTGSGVAHCPSSNMRLASGIAPVRAMLDAGVAVGLGVDGSASSDSGHMLNEARMAMLLQRVGGNAAAMTARDALRLATRGGARVLRRETEVGQLAAGYAADLAVFDTETVDMAGSGADPVAALVLCGPQKATHTIVHGRVVVLDGALTTIDLPVTLERHRALSMALING